MEKREKGHPVANYNFHLAAMNKSHPNSWATFVQSKDINLIRAFAIKPTNDSNLLVRVFVVQQRSRGAAMASWPSNQHPPLLDNIKDFSVTAVLRAVEAPKHGNRLVPSKADRGARGTASGVVQIWECLPFTSEVAVTCSTRVHPESKHWQSGETSATHSLQRHGPAAELCSRGLLASGNALPSVAFGACKPVVAPPITTTYSPCLARFSLGAIDFVETHSMVLSGCHRGCCCSSA